MTESKGNGRVQGGKEGIRIHGEQKLKERKIKKQNIIGKREKCVKTICKSNRKQPQ